MGARNQVGIGLSYRLASLYSLATQFHTRFLESIPRPIAGLKFSTQYERKINILILFFFSFLQIIRRSSPQEKQSLGTICSPSIISCKQRWPLPIDFLYSDSYRTKENYRNIGITWLSDCSYRTSNIGLPIVRYLSD
jgi:hypothetical protein